MRMGVAHLETRAVGEELGRPAPMLMMPAREVGWSATV